jgi:hypothetical protein
MQPGRAGATSCRAGAIDRQRWVEVAAARRVDGGWRLAFLQVHGDGLVGSGTGDGRSRQPGSASPGLPAQAPDALDPDAAGAGEKLRRRVLTNPALAAAHADARERFQPGDLARLLFARGLAQWRPP